MTTKNAMHRRAQEYLDERRRLGYALSTTGARLLAFARFADKVGHKGPLTLKLIVDWAKGQATRPTPITWARRVDIIRPFAKFCARYEPKTAIPPIDMFGPAYRRLTPHIYSDEEIADLLAAAGRLRPAGTLRPATYRTLFGLIAATGLRRSEALKLLCTDFDAAQNRLTIRETKLRKSRHVYLHPTVTEQLVRYGKLRDRFTGKVPSKRLFVTKSGTALSEVTVQKVFERLRAELGWVARGGHGAPRIHDLRHTFICKRVKLWQRDGADIDHAMITSPPTWVTCGSRTPIGT